MKLPRMVLKLQSSCKYLTEITIYNVQRAITPKVCEAELQFLCSACHLMVVNISVKFQKIILNRFSDYRVDTSV